ncbi:potassium channel family protein [Sphingomonas sp. S1-29]|uniref:potassium channel family protein n=1 Tax=Sphingomonas sp. S1-29 TaxID=2991074 RepID=UPI00223F189B|nr:potassium channel family protein [Sphingomonas sp. S1-29]UZK70432.1 potassium channel family protein [Sphingomonas sp. S1-29]
MTLPAQLVLASLMVTFTIGVHLGGLAALLGLLRRHHAGRPVAYVLLHDSVGILAAAFGLFALHAIEIWAYAALYAAAGALGSFEEALYFSTSTYTTIGYGDVVLPPGWRVFGAIEGANGIILLGWSTAFFFAVVSRIRLLELELETRAKDD